jgi:competence protein ComEC
VYHQEFRPRLDRLDREREMDLTVDSAASGLAHTTPGSRLNDTREGGAGIQLFTKSPALILAGCFAAGIAAAGSDHAPARILLRALPLVLSASGLSLLLGLCFTRARREHLAFLAALLGFAFAGSATALLFPFRFPPLHLSNLHFWEIDLTHPVRVVGRLIQDPLPAPSGLELDLEAASLGQGPAGSWSRPRPVTGRIRLWLATTNPFPGRVPAEFPSLNDGDWIEAVVRLRPPRVYHNPGSFDFRHRAESIGDLYWEGTVEGVPHRLQPSTAPTVGAALRRVRNSLSHAIDRLYPPWSAEGRNGAVLKAILLGDRSALDSSIVDPFRQSGLYHLLVIAGLHVGLLAFLVMGGLRLTGLGRTSRSLVLLAIMLVYALIVEQRAPTLRATLMLGIFIVGKLLDRDHAALNAIGLAALVLLFTRPAWLYDSGFQLSFAAALVIAGIAVPVLSLSTEPYRRALHRLDDVERDIVLPPRSAQFRLDLRSVVAALRRHWAVLGRRPDGARRLVTWPLQAALAFTEIVIFSAVLQIGLLLPMVETFHRVTLAGIGLNALALPLMTVLLAVAFPTTLLATVSPAAAVWPAKVLTLILAGLFSLTGLPRVPDWLSYRVPAPPAPVALGFVLTLLAVALYLRGSRHGLVASGAAFGVFAALVMVHPFAPQLPANSLEVTALDCGRGEAVFLVLPDRASVLVGAGGSSVTASAVENRWDPGENIVSPYLWSRGIKNLDILIVLSTRGASLDGVSSILQNFRIRELWCPRGLDEQLPVLQGYPVILTEARRRGVRIREVFAGETLTVGVTSFDIFTLPAEAGSGAGAKDDSLAFRVSAGPSSALIAGTLSTRAQHQIPESGSAIRSEVLAAARLTPDSPQHSWFLERVSPSIIIRTAGQKEEPKESVLPNALAPSGIEAAGTPILRTDRDGAVTVEMKGSSSRVRTFRGGGYIIP